jgi:hypothetical protein
MYCEVMEVLIYTTVGHMRLFCARKTSTAFLKRGSVRAIPRDRPY